MLNKITRSSTIIDKVQDLLPRLVAPDKTPVSESDRIAAATKIETAYDAIQSELIKHIRAEIRSVNTVPELLDTFRDSCRGFACLMLRAEAISRDLVDATVDPVITLTNAINNGAPQQVIYDDPLKDFFSAPTPDNLARITLNPEHHTHADYELLAALPLLLILSKSDCPIRDSAALKNLFFSPTCADEVIASAWSDKFPLLGHAITSSKLSWCEDFGAVFGVLDNTDDKYAPVFNADFLEVFADRMLRFYYEMPLANDPDYIAIAACKRMTLHRSLAYMSDNVLIDPANLLDTIMYCLGVCANNGLLYADDFDNKPYLYSSDAFFLTRCTYPRNETIYIANRTALIDMIDVMEALNIGDNDIYPRYDTMVDAIQNLS